MPFTAMYFLSKNYHKIKRHKGFLSNHFNPLMEGINTKGGNSLIYYYYGMFLCYRLVLSAVIVFLIDFPSA